VVVVTPSQSLLETGKKHHSRQVSGHQGRAHLAAATPPEASAMQTIC